MHRADASVVRVSLADKLHNLRAILLDYRRFGESLWPRFNASRQQTLWYYRELFTTFRERRSSPMVGELDRTLDVLEQLVSSLTT